MKKAKDGITTGEILASSTTTNKLLILQLLSSGISPKIITRIFNIPKNMLDNMLEIIVEGSK
jgi:hypothetical protein